MTEDQFEEALKAYIADWYLAQHPELRRIDNEQESHR